MAREPPTPVPTATPEEARADPLTRFNERDRRRLLEIVRGSLWQRYAIGPAERREFRQILAKLDPWTPQAVADLEERLTGPFLRAERYFWEDAVETRMSHTPIRSERRRQLEELLLQRGYVSGERLAKREELMDKIAKREVVDLGTMEIVLDEAAIGRMIAGIDEDKQRVHSLFVPEQR